MTSSNKAGWNLSGDGELKRSIAEMISLLYEGTVLIHMLGRLTMSPTRGGSSFGFIKFRIGM